VETLIRVAQAHDVSLKRDGYCARGQDVVGTASNIVIGDEARDDSEVEGRKGHVICDVEDLPFAKPPFEVERTKYATDKETYADAANVHCSIYSTGEGQVTRGGVVLEALADAPVERRSCPTARGEPVTVERLIAAAKTHGLRLLRDARCTAPGVVAQASTILPYSRPERSDTVFYEQSEVTCLVRASAAPGAEELRVATISSGKRVDLTNVSCTILPYSQNESTQVGRVRATLEDLD